MQNLFVGAVALALMSASAQAQTSTPFAAAVGANAPLPTPFASNNGQTPPNYSHPLFALSHDYPSTLAPPPPEPPWRHAIGDGQITVENAGAYVAALKEYVSQDMRLLLDDSPKWDPAALGWYNEPWTGYLREATHGMYVGSSPFAPSCSTARADQAVHDLRVDVLRQARRERTLQRLGRDRDNAEDR